jgi:drug/metabolite transporter (DMT)-like permease
MCWASSFGEAWLVAGLWQVTIICGVLLVPARGGFPWKTLIFSALILAGVVLLQIGHRNSGSWWAAGLVLVGAIAYPLGNRKIMRLADGTLTAVQRVTAMTVLSLPLWAVLAVIALVTGKPPTGGQAIQTLAVALCSGVIATVLFFQATDRVRNDPVKLGAVEATQAGEVVFSVLGEALFFGTGWPGPWATVGLALIIVGMLVHSLHTRRRR